jgi:hypothetical protein
MAGVLEINGTDLLTLGLRVVSVTGLDDVPAERRPSAPILGGDRHVALSDIGDVEPRELVAECFVQGTSTSDLRAKLDAIAALTRRACVIRTDRMTDRELVGWRVRGTALRKTPQLWTGQRVASVQLAFTCEDPSWRARTEDTVAFTTNTAIPLGSWPSRPTLEVTAGAGGCSNPLITLKNSAGTTIGTLSCTVSLPTSGDKLTINSETGVITKTLSGVTTSAQSTRSDASLFPIVLDPDLLGDYLTSAWPSLSGTLTGTGTFACLYRKRWA